MLQSASHMLSAADNYRWLTSAEAAPLLETAATEQLPLTTQVNAWRQKLSPQRTHLLLEQVSLRKKAIAKFTAAAAMYFTAQGLEQATDEIVAAYKARRFARASRVFDLCAGIGGDLLALARVCHATAVDRDPIMAILAEANARSIAETLPDFRACQVPAVWTRDVAEVDVGECDAWHIDPDRRSRGRRTTRVELHEPGVEVLAALLARQPNAALKLAPAATMPQQWSAEAELEWISRGRECRQLVAWFGGLAQAPGRRRATVLGPTERTIVGVANEEPAPSGPIDRYVFEPDAAVLAAHLSATLAREHALRTIAPGSVYCTGPRPIMDPALACFEVCEVLPLRVKPLAALLRTRNIGTLEIKKRGVEHDPETLRRQLRPCGDQSATLIVTRIDRREIAIVARRVVASD